MILSSLIAMISQNYRGICSVFGAPKIICVEPTQKKRSHIRAVTNQKFATATHKRK